MFLDFDNYDDFKKLMKEKDVAASIRNDGYKISTIKAPDRVVNPYSWDYETAIIYPNGNVKIIDEYETLEDALKGHSQYLNMELDELLKVKGI